MADSNLALGDRISQPRLKRCEARWNDAKQESFDSQTYKFEPAKIFFVYSFQYNLNLAHHLCNLSTCLSDWLC